jgi:hypothetical protein
MNLKKFFYICNMRLYLLILLLLAAQLLAAQEEICKEEVMEHASDLMYESGTGMGIISEGTWNKNIFEDADIVMCRPGFWRSSPGDVKKRFGFEWKVRYSNVYITTRDGIAVEGMNEHGLSASLLPLEESRLPAREAELIPLAGSMAVNFFIDYFKSIDTALLAVWDIRLFNDLDLPCGYPFRIVLHDTTGNTLYLEYIEGIPFVYTPEAPAFIVGGPPYSRLLTLKHIKDSTPRSQAEEKYVDFIDQPQEEQIPAIDSFPAHAFPSESYIRIIRDHRERSLGIVDGNTSRTYHIKNAKSVRRKEKKMKLY